MGNFKKIRKFLILLGLTSSETTHNDLRNPGMEFSLDLISSISVNRSAVERRCSNYGPRRSIKKDNQAAWLLKAITLMDLTT